jgi:hypothetical protein
LPAKNWTRTEVVGSDNTIAHNIAIALSITAIKGFRVQAPGCVQLPTMRQDVETETFLVVTGKAAALTTNGRTSDPGNEECRRAIGI